MMDTSGTNVIQLKLNQVKRDTLEIQILRDMQNAGNLAAAEVLKNKLFFNGNPHVSTRAPLSTTSSSLSLPYGQIPATSLSDVPLAGSYAVIASYTYRSNSSLGSPGLERPYSEIPDQPSDVLVGGGQGYSDGHGPFFAVNECADIETFANAPGGHENVNANVCQPRLLRGRARPCDGRVRSPGKHERPSDGAYDQPDHYAITNAADGYGHPTDMNIDATNGNRNPMAMYANEDVYANGQVNGSNQAHANAFPTVGGLASSTNGSVGPMGGLGEHAGGHRVVEV